MFNFIYKNSITVLVVITHKYTDIIQSQYRKYPVYAVEKLRNFFLEIVLLMRNTNFSYIYIYQPRVVNNLEINKILVMLGIVKFSS